MAEYGWDGAQQWLQRRLTSDQPYIPDPLTGERVPNPYHPVWANRMEILLLPAIPAALAGGAALAAGQVTRQMVATGAKTQAKHVGVEFGADVAAQSALETVRGGSPVPDISDVIRSAKTAPTEVGIERLLTRGPSPTRRNLGKEVVVSTVSAGAAEGIHGDNPLTGAASGAGSGIVMSGLPFVGGALRGV